MAEKGKMTVIFLIIAILFAIMLFYSGDSKKDTVSDFTEAPNQPALVESTETETMSPEEISKTEQQASETTFWMWQGIESGEASTEYITLCGDGMYILTIELAEHDPYEEQGVYKKLNSEGTILSIPYKQKFQKAEIKGNTLTVGDRTFMKLSSSHF